MHLEKTEKILAATLGLERLVTVDTATKVPAGAFQSKAQCFNPHYWDPWTWVCAYLEPLTRATQLGGDLGKNEMCTKDPNMMEVRLLVIPGDTLVPDERNILDPNHEASTTSKRQHTRWWKKETQGRRRHYR